jgi:G:T-mismatch repair DNA endonuclease (very short patch repair protein)
MSEALHGNPATRKRDRAIREELRSLGYEVLEVAYGDLSDREAMRRHLARLGRILLGKERAASLWEDDSWFQEPE